jgi:hemerythrin
MKWTDDLSVGVELIDTQHKALIDAVNELFNACSKGLGRKKISETLEFLQNYVVTHFSDEEAVQRKSGYPEYANHKKLHAEFIKSVTTYSQRLETDGPSISLVADFNSFVTNWLIYHISREDKKIGQFINSK